MADKKEMTVRIKLPRIKGEDAKYVSINEQSWLIKRGEPVDVPWYVAELLENSERAENEAYDFVSSNSQ